MIPFKKILTCTDFSDPSYEALKSAREIAKCFKAELSVVHVVPLVPVTPSTIDHDVFNVPLYQQGLQVSYKELLDRAVAKWISNDISTRAEVLHGSAAQEIVRFADEEAMDLIVISTHGETGLGHFVFGSVAEKVVRLAPCPVLTVKIRSTDS